jgi:pyruvate,water dikinase
MSHIVFNINGLNEPISGIGNKARNLFLVKSLGFEVPDFFVIDASVSNIDSFKKEILEAFDRLGTKYVAIRSSAIGEDGFSRSFAGQYKSVLNVEKGSIMDTIRDCKRQAYSQVATHYSGGKILEMAIIIQKMIHPDLSGVSFSVDPVRKNGNVVVIESVVGLCDKLVSGLVSPEHYMVNKDTESTFHIPNDIVKVFKATKSLEAEVGFPVDIEWAIENEKLYILQMRPITTL